MKSLKSSKHGRYRLVLKQDVDNEKLFIAVYDQDNLIETFDFLIHDLLKAEKFFDKMSNLLL